MRVWPAENSRPASKKTPRKTEQLITDFPLGKHFSAEPEDMGWRRNSLKPIFC